MSSHQPLILLLEDDLLCATPICRAIDHEFPDVRLLHARSLDEAQVLASDLTVDLFLLDIHVPGGNGIDFLCDMATVQPDARAIMMSGMITPEFRMKAEELGVIHLLEKPIRLKDLVRAIRAELTPDAADSFHASLACMTPIDIVQFKCMGGATGGVEFSTGEKVGEIIFEKGNIIHAQIGSLSGVEAFYEIVSWRSGTAAELLQFKRPAEPTISGNWQMLLLNAARNRDEKASQRV